MGLPNTNPLTVEYNSSCTGPAPSNRPGTGHRYKSTEPDTMMALQKGGPMQEK